MANMARRARSAPPRLLPEVPVPDDDDDVQHHRANSNGCGENSPTAFAKLSELHWQIRTGTLLARPTVDVNTWDFNNRIYVKVNFNPVSLVTHGGDRIELPAVNPHRWHTTLCVSEPLYGWRLPAAGAEAMPNLRTMAEAIFRTWTDRHRNDDGSILIPMAPPPWRKSWTFGFRGPVLAACAHMQFLSEATMVHYGLAHRERREIHISWN